MNTNLKGGFPHRVSRGGKREDVAGPATFLASEDADHMNGVLRFADEGQLA